jgi:flagellar biosynthesis/type III secretory pathway ATPase
VNQFLKQPVDQKVHFSESVEELKNIFIW